MRKETIEQFEKETGWFVVDGKYYAHCLPPHQNVVSKETREDYLDRLSEWLDEQWGKAEDELFEANRLLAEYAPEITDLKPHKVPIETARRMLDELSESDCFATIKLWHDSILDDWQEQNLVEEEK